MVNRIMRGNSHDKGLFVNIWDSIPIYLEKTNIRECASLKCGLRNRPELPDLAEGTHTPHIQRSGAAPKGSSIRFPAAIEA